MQFMNSYMKKARNERTCMIPFIQTFRIANSDAKIRLLVPRDCEDINSDK